MTSDSKITSKLARVDGWGGIFTREADLKSLQGGSSWYFVKIQKATLD